MCKVCGSKNGEMHNNGEINCIDCFLWSVSAYAEFLDKRAAKTKATA